MRARAINIHWTCFHKHTPRSYVRDEDFDRFGLYCDAPHIFNCTRAEGSKVKVCPDCDFCVTTRNQLVVHEWLVLNHSAAVHVLTSRTFYTYHTILNCQLHGDPNSLFHDLVVRIELNVPTLLHLLSCANNASGIAVALVKRRSSQSRFS